MAKINLACGANHATLRTSPVYSFAESPTFACAAMSDETCQEGTKAVQQKSQFGSPP